MSSPNRQAGEPGSPPAGASSNPLHRIPVAVRMLFYGSFFLSALLIGLPWLAYRIDVFVPAWHVEVGWFRVAGVVLFVGFLVTYLRSSYSLSSRGRGGYVEFDPPQAFVETGPYRRVRNPIAGCAVLMLLGEALAFSSTGIFLLFLVAVPLAHLQVVLLEEPLLRKRFGQSYAEYLARVPRWIPRRPGRNAG